MREVFTRHVSRFTDLQVAQRVLEEPQPQQPPLAAMDAGVLPVENVVFRMGHQAQYVAGRITQPGNIGHRPIGIGRIAHRILTTVY
jgi:hypothetical protein